MTPGQGSSARLLEALLRPSWTGHLRLLCPRDQAIGELTIDATTERRRTVSLAGNDVKNTLLRLAFALLDDDAPPSPPASGPTLPQTEGASPDTSTPDPSPEASERPPTSDPSSRRPAPWGLEALIVYEHLVTDRPGALAAELGGLSTLSPPLGVRLFLGGLLGLQAVEDLRLSGVSLGAGLELRPRPWLTIGAGAVHSVLRFSGASRLVSDDPRSAQWGGQLDLGLAPAGARSGMIMGFRLRRYLQARAVRIDGEEVLHIPAWTASVGLGYRFYAEP